MTATTEKVLPIEPSNDALETGERATFGATDSSPRPVDASTRRGAVRPSDASSREVVRHSDASSRGPSDSLHLRTQFLRRVAHDIASPAGVTMTVVEELANESRRPELVAMARRGLRRLLRLSEQLALAADLEAGALSPSVTPEDLGALVKSALDSAVAIDGRRDVVTSCDVPPGKVVANVDRRLVASVIREIVGNALRIASGRVAVDVTLSVPEGGPDPYPRVDIRVQDDGPGFSTEALDAMGERFTRRSSARGLGLSLSMAKEVLAAHGGELRIEASTLPPGRRGACGAAVIVTLPTGVVR